MIHAPLTPLQILAMLERRGVITTEFKDKDECCGLDRDDDGFCRHRPSHKIYVPVT